MKAIEQVENIRANGHYAQAMVYNGAIYVSGQFSVNSETGERKFGTIQEETEQVLSNIELTLKKAGSDRSKILKTTAYVCSLEDWEKVNEAYECFFGEHKPARSIVKVEELHYGFKVEIEAIAGV